MDLTIYDIIKGPRITEKAYRLNKQFANWYLKFILQANKPLIAEALENYLSKADKIAYCSCKGRTQTFRPLYYKGKTRKKAIVTLKEGQSIDIMGN